MSCDCGAWQISGLLCAHAAAVIDYQGHSTHEYTNWYYSKEAFKLTYSDIINPIPDPAMWPDVEGATPDPPKKRNSVGKLKKSRKRAADEGHAPSKCFTKRCTSCGVMGHNSMTCKQPFAVTKKKSKTKKKGKEHSSTNGSWNPSQPLSQANNIICSHIGSMSQP
ncbi:hypothetical protein LWI28_014959 [Acer negundo]|uniref:SWIM-type domain-containing protein n=1 Tax=Acer negundo TaxID=4023 RepID=A0AAD5NHX0_ACENE|nr:hypothetical protein LWI28_014959 [Acer negundo]